MTENKRKFEWVDKWAKMTGERARIDAKVHKTAIVYNTEAGWVKEHYDGTIEIINTKENRGENMREKERINRIMSLLQRIWEQQPDVRFNQLISNLQHMYSSQNEGYGQRMMKEKGSLGDEAESSYLDLFYLEDDKWEEFLQKLVDNRATDD
ncbi:hypothetical protein RGU12_08100 [Fredinandcohnia sp. QZ13]|uniref:hypothetical protein n=1 Tax=Fredinandcohnia sp. QZ13 TaxID=3073144 RepID=UPI0028537089|nr:hypothetical protein [Fredinandcohnia sp. QZ13]MDR4887523.1 hypothetical protein [Fredinandcohnia sp. QZ13]